MNSFQLRLRRIKSAPFITIGLIAVNVIVFVLSEIGGSSEDGRHMYEFGAMLTSAVAEDGEYWRLLTSMFLHFGFEHLASNMLVLFALGTTLEHGIGRLRLVLIYFVSGVGANILSQIWSMRAGEEVLSGAIFGLMGALVFAGLFAREWMGALSPARVALMLALSLFHGVNEGVDNVAHIGGLFLGFLLAILLLKVFPSRRP